MKQGSDTDTRPGERNIHFTAHALQNIDLRGIRRADVVRALQEDSGQHVDAKTGHVVSRMGDVRIVAKREAGRDVVLTAMRESEFLDDAG